MNDQEIFIFIFVEIAVQSCWCDNGFNRGV